MATKLLRKVYFLDFIYLLWECTNGERSREMHMHIGGKENENIVSYMKIKYVGS